LTTIIGYITNESVIFCADRQRSSLTLNGEFLKSNSNSMKKIYRISDKIAIAAGGVTEPMEQAITNIKTQIALNSPSNTDSILALCKENFSKALTNFVERTPGLSYNNLYYLIGGISPNTNKTFLFVCRSDQEFTPVEYKPIQLVTMGDAHKELSGPLTKNLNTTPPFLLNEKYFLINLFSKAIADCSSRHPTTGQETYSTFMTNRIFEEHYRNAEGKPEQL
jgi:20S proteasome alpha/beta subunit